MAEKLILENFEEFAGLDLESTALTRKPTSFRVLTNSRFGEGGSLRKRPGYQKIGQTALFEKIHSYKYQDTLSGETKEELLAINEYLWRLKESYITVSNGTALTATISFVSGTPRLVIYDSGVAQTFGGNAYIDLTGSVGSLMETIDAHATYACTNDTSIRKAKANGNNSVVTVDAGHTYVVGDWIYANDSVSGDLKPNKVTAIGATTITVDGSLNVVDNQWIGALESLSAGIPIGSYSGTTTLTLPFWYWDVVPYTTYHYGVIESLRAPFDKNSFSNTNPIRPCFLNAQNVCYIYYGTDSTEYEPFKGYPFKYDGQALYREGLPKPATPTASEVPAGSLTGSYRYKASYVCYDAKGNIIEGEVSDEFTASPSAENVYVAVAHPTRRDPPASPIAQVNGTQVGVTTVTIFNIGDIAVGDWVVFESSGGAVKKITATTATSISFSGAINVSDLDEIFALGTFGLNTKSAYGSATNASTITVASGHAVEVSDLIYFYDTLRSQYTTRVVSAKTDTSITWASGGNVSLSTGFISSGLRVVIYRTKAGGNIFYKLAELPLSKDFPEAVYTDSKSDSLLVERLIEPEIGFEPSMPPKARFATIHQGVRVASGIYPGAGSATGENEGNTIAIYDPINIESVPIASGTNYIDLPSNVKGSISAIASDNDNSLAVFKSNAYYAINGDILGGAASINAMTEGDYGIASHNSIKKINGAIFGVGTLGVLVVSNGQILADVSRKINSVIRNNKLLKLSAAEAENDYFNMGYAVHIPHNTSTASITDSKTFFFDYESNIWLEDSWSLSGCYPVGGTTMHEDRQYFMGNGVAYRELRQDDVLTALAQVYADHGTAISRSMRFIYHLDTPSTDKEFLRIKLFSMYNPGEEDLFVAATPTIKTYKDFQTTAVDSQFTLTFPAITKFEDEKKLKANKARALEFEILDNAINECLHLTGWQIVVDDGFRKEDVG